jgi:hypothetical protein
MGWGADGVRQGRARGAAASMQAGVLRRKLACPTESCLMFL